MLFALYAAFQIDGYNPISTPVMMNIELKGNKIAAQLAQRPPHASTGKTAEPAVKGQVVLVLGSNGRGGMNEIDDQDQLAITKMERTDYAEKHNYSFDFYDLNHYQTDYFNYTTNFKPVWYKLPMILDSMKKHPEAEWIWWLDQDAIFMEPDTELNDYLLSERALMTAQQEVAGDLILAQNDFEDLKKHQITCQPVPYADVNIIVAQNFEFLNAGSLFFRNNQWTRDFIDFWSDWYFYDPKFERFEEQGILLHLILAHESVRRHTAFVKEKWFNASSHNWAKGDLIVHLPGCSYNHECKAQWYRMMGIRDHNGDVDAWHRSQIHVVENP